MGYIEDVNTQLNRLQTKLNDCYDAISDKGGTLPVVQDYDNLANAILSIAGDMAAITVTAESGGTVIATKGSKNITCSWNGSTYVGIIDEYGVWTVTFTSAQGLQGSTTVEVTEATNYLIILRAAVNVTITGSGNTTYCYATINDTKRSAAGTYSADVGSTITFGVYGSSSANYGEVRINGSQVLRVTSTSGTRTYDWVVPTGISKINISFNYNSSSSNRYARITVTTQ